MLIWWNGLLILKAWYDGYHFGDFDVYCPWDVMNYLLELQRDPKATPISYWKIPVTMRSFALLYNHPLYSSGMKIYSAASEKNLEIFLDKNRQIKLVKLLFPCYYEHRNLKQQTAAKIKERCERK